MLFERGDASKYHKKARASFLLTDDSNIYLLITFSHINYLIILHMTQNVSINRCCKIVDNVSRSQLNEIVQIGADTLPLIDVVILPADDGHSKMN